jgi:hypothetical protein
MLSTTLAHISIAQYISLQLINGLSGCATSWENDEENERGDDAGFPTKNVARLCPRNDEASVRDQVASENPSEFIVTLEVVGNGKARGAYNGDLHVHEKQTKAYPCSTCELRLLFQAIQLRLCLEHTQKLSDKASIQRESLGLRPSQAPRAQR